MPAAIVLFDLDDTLTDANTFAADVLVHAARGHGRTLSAETVRRHPGAPYVPLLQRELALDLEAAQAIYADYVQRYRETMAAALRERTGATPLLRTLAARGARIGLVSNKLEGLAREILAQFGWAGWFGAVVGQDTCEYRKPHPGIVHHALDAVQGDVAHAAFVGDTPSDMQCARDAGVPLVVGLLGTTAPETLVGAGATRVCANLDEVRRLLAD